MITIFCDGASKKNPGVCGIGIVISKEGKTLCEISEMIGQNYTNNIAEYCSVYRAMNEIVEQQLHQHSTPISLIMDSELVIKQLKGEYRVKQEQLKILHAQIKQFISKHELKISFIWVPREQNIIADGLANQGIDKEIQTSPQVQELLKKMSSNQNLLNILPSESHKNTSNTQISKSQNLQQSQQMLVAERVFFSKTSCLKFQISKRKEIYMHIGSLQKNSWEWVICKFSDVELSEICSVIKKEKDKCAFFHKNSHNGANSSTQIWCNSNDKGFSIKIQNHSKLLSQYEADVLYELIRRGIWEINTL